MLAALNKHHRYVLSRMVRGAELRRRGKTRATQRYTLEEKGKRTRLIALETIAVLDRRMLIEAQGKSGEDAVPYVLTSRGRMFAERLPPPSPDYMTAREEREAEAKRRIDSVLALIEEERQPSVTQAERGVLEALDAFFEGRGSWDDVEAAHRVLRAARGPSAQSV